MLFRRARDISRRRPSCRWLVGVPDRWPSGLRRTPGKCVTVNSRSRVRIPLCPPLKRAPCGPFFMADRDRYYGPLFDKIADRQFWARAKRAIRGRAEDEKHAKHVFRNPSLSAKSIRPPCGALLICVATSVFVYERLRIAHLHRNRIDIAAVIAHAITNPCPVPHRDVPHLPITGRTGAPR